MDDILIPIGVYVQITFESAVTTFLGRLAEQLQTNAEGVFFVQQDSHHRLGASPFHIKLISSADLTGISYLTVSRILRDVAVKCTNVQGQVLPVCVVNSDGLVSLKIASSDCLLVGKHISQSLFDRNGWCPDYEVSLLVSIGTFCGPHTNAFETWLNGELRSNSSAFPFFNAEFLELSEQCGMFLEESARFTLNKQIQTDSDIHVLTDAIEKLSDQEINNFDTETEVLVVTNKDIKEEESNGNRLILSTASITQKMGGAGVLKLMKPKEDSKNMQLMFDRYSITPIDIISWRAQSSKLMMMLDAMLLTIGPKDFLFALDTVANFNQADSLSSALIPHLARKRGRYLELTTITDLHIEAEICSEMNDISSEYNLEGTAVPISVGCGGKLNQAPFSNLVTADPSSSGSSIGSNQLNAKSNSQLKSQQLVCFLSAGKQTLVDSRTSQLSVQPNRALITLHINADPISALGLQPLTGRNEFYLPIGWIDIKDYSSMFRHTNTHSSNSHNRGINQFPNRTNSTYINSAQSSGSKFQNQNGFNGSFHGVNGINGSSRVGNNNGNVNSDGHRHVHGRGVSTGTVVKNGILHFNTNNSHGSPGSGIFRVGDWTCPVCRSLVFSFRPDCFKCRTLRPSTGPHIVPRQPQKTVLKPDGDVREGDWLCLTCKGHNFADKLACFTCRTLRHKEQLDSTKMKTSVNHIGDSDANDCSKTDREGDNKVDGVSLVPVVDADKVLEKPVPVRLMPGDWTCPSCKENVFAKRYRCYKCSTLKPR